MTSNFGKKFGELVAKRRAKLGFTQASLSEVIGITPVALSRLENGGVASPRSATINALMSALDFNASDVLELREGSSVTSVISQIEEREKQSGDHQHEIIQQYGSLAKALLSVDDINRDALELLAFRFGAEDLQDKSDGALREILTQKALEYQAFRKQIEAIDDRVTGIANLKGAARDAAERLDLEEVEALFERIDEVETTISAETKEARAANALLRGRVDQAYQLYCDAADSFRAIDLVETASRRDKYRDALYEHGLRYGGTGVLRAIEIMRPTVEFVSKLDDKELWLRVLNNLAIALDTQAERESGPVASELRNEAISIYRRLLGTFSEASEPLDWAMTQNNLAIALEIQGTRTAGPEGADLLAQAVSAYRAALRVRTEADHPVDWAMTQNNLGGALQTQGTRTAGPEGTDLLAQAVTAYRAALRIRTEADHPVNWAATQNNLANTLQIQGTRTAGPEGADLLAQAVTAYRAALRVRTEADHPVQWAETQENLALAHLFLADHDTTTDPRPHLETALAHVEAALTVYDPDHMSYNHDKATRLRDHICDRLAALD